MTTNENYQASLGRVSERFQTLEALIAFIVWKLISNDQKVGQIVTSQLPFSRLCDLLGSLFRHKVQDQSLRDELDELLNRASQAEQKRNTVIHSIWLTDENSDRSKPTRVKISARRNKGLQLDVQEMRVDELDEIAHVIVDVSNDLAQFLEKLAVNGLVDYGTPDGEQS